MKIKFLLIMKMDIIKATLKIILKKINKNIYSYKLLAKQIYLLTFK